MTTAEKPALRSSAVEDHTKAISADGTGYPADMASLAQQFTDTVASLSDDWTNLEFDLRVYDERRYVDAAVMLVTANPQPYSKHDWHWRLVVAHHFGHGTPVPSVHLGLKLLDDAGIAGELVMREVRTGRTEVVQMWGRTESVRQEFKRRRAQ